MCPLARRRLRRYTRRSTWTATARLTTWYELTGGDAQPTAFCTLFISQEWLDYINPRVLGTVDAAKTGTPILPPGAPTELDPDMKRRFANMLERAETLAKAADEAGVTIMFDAEQSKPLCLLAAVARVST